MINENAQFMTAMQLERLVGLLNLYDGKGASTEWEIVLSNSFSRFARVQYEPNLGGTSHPDLFVSEDNGIDPFVVEITSVSDAGYEHDNPVDDFQRAFHELAEKKQLPAGGFHFAIGDEDVGDFPEQKTRLRLPTRAELPHFVKETYSTFLEDVKAEPNRAHTHELKDSRAEVTVTYDPRRVGYSGAGYPSYKSLKGRTRNTLYEALKNKANTLKRCGFEGTRGIVVCDGGASYLSDSLGDATTFGLRAIVADFFRKHSSISFIVVVRTILSSQGSRQVRGLSRDIWLNPYLPNGPNDNRLVEALHRSIDTLPRPAQLAINAYRQAGGKFRLFENSFFGGGMRSSKQIKISARTVHALLAGQLTPERYLAGHEDFVKFLEDALKQGRSISAVHLERSENHDDDWLTIEFGGQDPAIHRFVNPHKT
jgi:hypothetical protein